ncbi:MAG: hypothetical protein V2I67_00310 [Thermoanaerobaculales bacterium]|nr:hypothetical protein [Thermoanaerobaculales bacterium]
MSEGTLSPIRTTVLLGVATVIAQSVLLREAMAATGGSEMAWGLVMALWLTGMGVGSRTGVRFGRTGLAPALPVLALLLAGAGTILFRAAPAITGAVPGETLTTWPSLWLWALAVAPAAIAGGLAFPILAAGLGADGPGRAYSLEAAGALVGGLVFTLILAPFGTVATLLVGTGLVGGAALWAIRPSAAAAALLICVLVSLPSGQALSRAGWRWADRPGELGARAETRHQCLEVSAGPPFALYSNGRLKATYPDPYTTLPRAHLMMLLHPDPQRVLAVGSVADGSLEAMVRHGSRRLLLVDEDPRLVPLVGAWYGRGFADLLRRSDIETISTDPIRAVSGERDLDLVILTDGDPATLRANRTRTVEFFTRCRRAMSEDGVLIVEVGVGDTYIGGTAGALLAVLADTVRAVFPTLDAIPGEKVLLVAGGPQAALTTDPGVLEKRLAERPEAAELMPSALVEVLLNADRRPSLLEFLEDPGDDINSISHPTAVALAATVHESRSGSSIPEFVAVLRPRGGAVLVAVLGISCAALLASAAGNQRRRARAAAWAVGFISMGWWLLLLGLWQSTKGSVYAEIGALTAIFMAGVAGGGGIGVRIRSVDRLLPRLLASGSALSLVLASGLPASLPIVLIPLLLLAGGLFTGSAFPALGAMAGGGSNRRGAGEAFAADEVGAAAAALVVGTLAIPWIGMTATALGLSALGAASIPAVWRE